MEITMDTSSIVECIISPSIGIARMGNSPDEFFIGPVAPGEFPQPDGGFKDSSRRVKRQAARFRIYGLNSKGEVVAELTAANADITWDVHVANRKAEWYQFEDR